jgi:hypothetical protein
MPRYVILDYDQAYGRRRTWRLKSPTSRDIGPSLGVTVGHALPGGAIRKPDSISSAQVAPGILPIQWSVSIQCSGPPRIKALWKMNESKDDVILPSVRNSYTETCN